MTRSSILMLHTYKFYGLDLHDWGGGGWTFRFGARIPTPRTSTPKISTFQNTNSQNVN